MSHVACVLILYSGLNGKNIYQVTFRGLVFKLQLNIKILFRAPIQLLQSSYKL